MKDQGGKSVDVQGVIDDEISEEGGIEENLGDKGGTDLLQSAGTMSSIQRVTEWLISQVLPKPPRAEWHDRMKNHGRKG